MSDLHLGASNSVLTELSADCHESIPNQASTPLLALAACLRTLAQRKAGDGKPSLILNGDILELALAGTNQASMNFVQFIDALARNGAGEAAEFPFADEIFFLPGNHDHHLWNTARETQYVYKYLTKVPAAERGQRLKPEYQTTNMFQDSQMHPVPAYLLNALFAGRPETDPLANIRFSTVYPNYGLINPERTRTVLFHHGHYVEPIYRLMSGLKDIFFPGRPQPEKIWDLEAENGAWVDFFWSTLGRSGAVGQGVELIYDKMQDEARFDQLLDRLAGALAPLVAPRFSWMSGITRPVLGFALRQLAKQHLSTRETKETDEVLSGKSREGLAKYVAEDLLPEIRRGNGGQVPPRVAFIFGHTHKPFEEQISFEGYPAPLDVYNSGGWVADTLAPEPLHGGSVIVINDALDVASIRLYQETASGARSPTEVHSLAADGQSWCESLREMVRADPAPWDGLSAAVQTALVSHRANLEYKVNSDLTNPKPPPTVSRRQ